MTLRPATMLDAELLLAWRNDPATRAASLEEARVEAAEHRRWLRAALDSPTRRLFIAEHEGEAVGTGRWDSALTSAVLSVTVAPQHRGRGYARQIIEALVTEGRRAGLTHFSAHVKPGNGASLNAFLGAGFTAPEVVVLTA